MTPVASLIGLNELARAATQINTVTFEPVLVFGTTALVYFALCWPLSLHASRLERRFAANLARRPEKLPVLAA